VGSFDDLDSKILVCGRVITKFYPLKFIRIKAMAKFYLELKPEPKVFPRMYLPRLANLTSTEEDSMFIRDAWELNVLLFLRHFVPKYA